MCFLYRGLQLHLDVSTLQSPVLHLDMSTLQGTELHLDMSKERKKEEEERSCQALD
jgi:hypothetical protein